MAADDGFTLIFICNYIMQNIWCIKEMPSIKTVRNPSTYYFMLMIYKTKMNYYE
jgi:hypothetical protein